MKSLSKSDRALAVGVVVFAVAVGVIGIRRPLYVDEAFSVLASGDRLRGVIGQLRNDNSLPLYYLLLHGWIRSFGASELATRSLSVLYYFAAIATACFLGKEVSGQERVGLYSAFFYAVSLQAIHVAQHVRMYSLLGLMGSLSALFFFRCFASDHPPTRRDWILFTAINVAGSFVHLWFAFLLFAEFLCCAIFFGWPQLRRLLVSSSVTAGIWALLWGRVFLEQMHNGSSGWMPKIDVWSAPGLLLEYYGGKYIGASILAACAILVIAGWRHMNNEEEQQNAFGGRRLQALVLLFSASIALPLAVSVLKPIYFLGRYSIVALPSLAVLLGWTLAAKFRPRVLAGFAFAVMALVLAVHIWMRNDVIENSEFVRPYAQSDEHAADQIAAAIRPGDTVVFTGLSRATVEYYFQRLGCERGVSLISYPAVNADHLGWADTRISQSALEAEGNRLAARLTLIGRAGTARIFVVPDDPLTSAMLSRSMAQEFPAATVTQ